MPRKNEMGILSSSGERFCFVNVKANVLSNDFLADRNEPDNALHRFQKILQASNLLKPFSERIRFGWTSSNFRFLFS